MIDYDIKAWIIVKTGKFIIVKRRPVKYQMQLSMGTISDISIKIQKYEKTVHFAFSSMFEKLFIFELLKRNEVEWNAILY